MAETHKLRIKIGDAEFEAEGSQESIKLQYDAFLAALAATPKSAAKPPFPWEGQGGGAPDPAANQDQDQLIGKAYNVDGDKDLVSLKYLPKGENREADALLLLLYGYSKLKGAEAVLGTQLLKAARQSGLTLDRVDRHIAKHDAFLMKGGARKGMKYSLNNQGFVKAAELLKLLMI
jgi:hypothetical protein